MTALGGIFKPATVIIDDVSEGGSWVREMFHRAAQRRQPPADIPPSEKPTSQHGETS